MLNSSYLYFQEEIEPISKSKVEKKRRESTDTCQRLRILSANFLYIRVAKSTVAISNLSRYGGHSLYGGINNACVVIEISFRWTHILKSLGIVLVWPCRINIYRPDQVKDIVKNRG
jgi:hypothetical protein